LAVEEFSIVGDLLRIKPEYQYKLEYDSRKYKVSLDSPKIPKKTAERMVIDDVIEDNTSEISYDIRIRKMSIIPKPGEIRIRHSSLVFVPKWIIKLKCEDVVYLKEILAASGTAIVNEMLLCPKDFSSWRRWDWKKSVYATCEKCGKAYCENHLQKVNNRFICLEHE
jgi:hypothetical protein